MSERAFNTPPGNSRVEFNTCDITIFEPARYAEHIDALSQSEFIAHGLEQGSIKKSYAWHSKHPDGYTALNAQLNCDPLVTKPARSWRSPLFAQLSAQLLNQGLEVHVAPHDTDSLYVSNPDSYRAFCIKGWSTIDQSHIDITSLTRTELLNGLAQDNAPAFATSPQLTESELEDFISIWGTTQDAIIEIFDGQIDTPLHKREQIHIRVSDPPEIPAPATPDVHHADELIDHDTHDAFETIGGMFAAKQELKRYVKRFKNPELAKQLRVPIPAFILQGPPGTGKSSLMRAFADESGATFQSVKGSELLNEYIGKTSRNVEEIFDSAFASKQSVVLCFDEIDRYLKADNHREFVNATKTFGQKIEEAAHYPHVLIAATMNASPDQLVSSIVRPGRMKVIEISSPNEYELADIWRAQLNDNLQICYTGPDSESPIYVFEQPLESISEVTSGSTYDPIRLGELSNGMTGADIHHILATLREDAMDYIVDYETVRQIKPADVQTAVARYRADGFRPNTD